MRKCYQRRLEAFWKTTKGTIGMKPVSYSLAASRVIRFDGEGVKTCRLKFRKDAEAKCGGEAAPTLGTERTPSLARTHHLLLPTVIEFASPLMRRRVAGSMK
jgi:hypothetical protein